MRPQLCNVPIHEQVDASRGDVRAAREVVHQTRARIEAMENELHAWVSLRSDLDRQVDALGFGGSPRPLHGISVGVKDLIDVAGSPTRAGSTITSEKIAERDAWCVGRLRELGAIVQGKTVTTEFGYFAPGPTRNPHALDHTPGGSSSGSAAAVGAGVLPLALGTQTAGSLTRPASYCGAAGMVMANDAIDMSGITGLSPTLDSLGMLTRTVEDLRTAYRAFVADESPTPLDEAAASVFIWSGSDLDTVEHPVRALLAALPQALAEIGMPTQLLDWDTKVRILATDHALVMAHEAAKTRASELDSAADRLSPQFRQMLEHGRTIDGADVRAALFRRDRSLRALGEMLGRDGVVIGPAALGPAPAGLAATGSPVLSRPWQLLGLPVVVVPGARTIAGLPLGLQIIGLPGCENAMLDLGVRLESVLRALPPVAQQPQESVS